MYMHESSVGLSSTVTTNPSLRVAIPVPAQARLYMYIHAKGRAT